MTQVAYDVVETESGALAVRDRVSGEVMHPGVGPLVEAQRLYAEPARLQERLSEDTRTPLVLLDVGLGAGSNALAAIAISAGIAASARPLAIVSFDRTLDPLRLALEPAHAGAFGLAGPAREAATSLLASHRFEDVRTRWRLQLGELPTTLALEPAESADVVFWDPFSPRSNPALWCVAAFRTLRRVCRDGATVHTYSAATATRTALLLAGFYVGLGVPSGRKGRPTTVASTRRDRLEAPLDQDFLARLADARVPFANDAPRDAHEQLAAHPQFAR